MIDTKLLSSLFTQLINTSENMLTAANNDSWDDVMKLDKVRYQLLDDLLLAKIDISNNLISQRSTALSELDSEINKVLKTAKLSSASGLKQVKSNRHGMKQYLDGQALPVS